MKTQYMASQKLSANDDEIDTNPPIIDFVNTEKSSKGKTLSKTLF